MAVEANIAKYENMKAQGRRRMGRIQRRWIEDEGAELARTASGVSLQITDMRDVWDILTIVNIKARLYRKLERGHQRNGPSRVRRKVVD